MTLNEIAILDMINTNAKEGLKRPIYYAVTVGPEMYMNLKPYFSRVGLAYRIVPVKNPDGDSSIDTEKMYDNMMNKFVWGGIENPNVYLDENIRRMCFTLRMMFVELIGQLMEEGKTDKALKALNYCMEKIPGTAIPHDYISTQLAMNYYQLGQKEKAKKLLEEIADNSFEYLKWYTTLTPNQLRSIDRDVQINQFILIKNVIPMFISQNDQESAMKYVNRLKSISIDPTAMLQQQ